MGLSEGKLRELADRLHERVPASTKLVAPNQDLSAFEFDSVTRIAVQSRIRDLRRMYGLGWLVRQETFHVPELECLEDSELSALLRDMERARECLVDGIGFEEAGLVRSRAQGD